MTKEEKIAYLNAQVSLFNAEIAAMIAENTHRLITENYIPYGEEQFNNLITTWSTVIGHDAVIALFND